MFASPALSRELLTDMRLPAGQDKHFAYNWADAQWMWERAQEVGAPLMAGSSAPLACCLATGMCRMCRSISSEVYLTSLRVSPMHAWGSWWVSNPGRWQARRARI